MNLPSTNAAPNAWRHPSGAKPLLSVLIPVYNERDNIGRLLDEVCRALRPLGPFQIIVVDDASGDDTHAVLAAARNDYPELLLARHPVNRGQSTAIATAARLAAADWLATLDGDGQNDPADLPRLLGERDRAGAAVKLIAGWRRQRQDSWSRRIASRIANAVRARLLGDATPDTGCGIKLFEREAFLALPRFNHMHRYLPALFQREGWSCVSVPVNHRPRSAGVSKYNNLQRLQVGLFDLVGVTWLLRRPCRHDRVQVLPALPAAAAEARSNAVDQVAHER